MIEILLETNDFIAIDKPPGMLSVPTVMRDQDPRPCAIELMRAQTKQELLPVHRLDEAVGGVLIFAKNRSTKQNLSALFESRKIEKRYLALTETKTDVPQPLPSFTWESKLVRGKKRTFEAAHGKLSITKAQILEKQTHEGNPVLLWELEPLTGRGHQLRYHLSSNGFPILGDAKYGATIAWKENGIALIAKSIAFDFGGRVEVQSKRMFTDRLQTS